MEYLLKRKKMKRIILRIQQDGQIQVSAPFQVPLSQIETFLEKHKKWIFETKQKLREKKRNQHPCKDHYEESESILLFGKERILHLEESQLSSCHLTDTHIYIFYRKEEKKELSQIIQNYFIEQLESFLKKELEYYSHRLQLFPNSFQIKSMKSAWGIYHRHGNYISFNSLLLTQSKEFISYVVVHELCHIQFLNHQKEFWNLVSTEIPNYKEIRKSSRI